MDAEEDTSSNSSGPSVSEKSYSTKRAQSESPEVVSSDPSTNKSKPDRSDEGEPPCKIQKQDPTCSAALKDPEASSESLKEEVHTSESPHTEDDTAMEVDGHSPLPTDPKSEIADTSVTHGENLKVPDLSQSGAEYTLGESKEMQDPVAMAENVKLPRSPSPTLDISCPSETSDVALETTESIVMDEDKTLHVSSSIAADVLSKPEASDKYLKRQDALDEDENKQSCLQPDTSNEPETSPKSLKMEIATEDKLSPSFQSDISSDPRKSEDLKTQNTSSATLSEQGPFRENPETEPVTGGEKLTADSSCQASSFQPDVSSEPGPSGEHLKTFESGILSEPGPSGEQRNVSNVEGEEKLCLSSFNLERGVIGNQSLDRETCEDIQAELDPRILNSQIVSTYYRLRDSYVRQRRKQNENSLKRQRSGKYSSGLIESFENKDEISIRGWLKYALPREAEYLNTVAALDDESSFPDPPSLEDDTTYSLSSGNIPVDDRLRWKRGIALGERILRIGEHIERCTPRDGHCMPNRDYNYEFHLTNDLMNILNDLARRISDRPLAPENLPPPPLEEFLEDVDSGNVSPNSLSFRLLPSIQEDDTSCEAASFISEEEPVLGASASLRPRHDQISRVLSEASLDSESSDSITYYPKDGDTSSCRRHSSIIDCPSIQDEFDSVSISVPEIPKEDEVASDLAEVHLDNGESESACSLEVHPDESPANLAEVNLENDESESTAYPTSSETSSDQNCSYATDRRKQDDSDGWC